MILNFKPTNYTLSLTPDFNTFTFSGTELLSFQVEKPLRTLRLDAEHITVKDCTMNGLKIGFEVSGNAIILDFGTELPIGTYTISIEYNGVLADDLSGWYRSTYEVEGKTEYMATSQFEPAFARRAFPCLDHPLYKATFDITLIVPPHHTALSNTLPVEETTLPDGKKRITFAQSPLMSTYLLYLGAGVVEMEEDQYKKTQLRGIAVPGKAQHTRFALEVTKHTLAYFEEYFQKPYPLPKLDLLAIPDFVVGAMENWGAITFRENVLLYDPEKSSVGTKQQIAITVAHELAHQWFGNLVTMKWWDDLWLNESFATFMAYKAVDDMFPSWNIWSDYVLDTVFAGMKLDSQQTTHPVQMHVQRTEDIEELFDEIAYDKGGSILRMIEGYLGADAFRDGLREYIASYAFSNAEGADLWRSLEKISGKNLSAIMQSYIQQPGFPKLSFSQENHGTAEQQKFSLLPTNDTSTVWSIPVVLSAGEKTERVLVSEKKHQFSDLELDSGFYANTNYSGFYISHYHSPLLKNLLTNMNSLTDIERMGLLHDYLYLLEAGHIELEEFIHVYQATNKDPRYAATLSYALGSIQKLYIITMRKDFLDILQTDATRALEITGYEPTNDENPLITALRSDALVALSHTPDKKIRSFIQNQFDRYIQSPTQIHPDLWAPMLVIAARINTANYEAILDLFAKSTSQETQAKYLRALGATHDTPLIQHTLQFALDKQVRFAQLPYIFATLGGNPASFPLIFSWLATNWTILQERAQGSTMILRRILKWGLPYAGAYDPQKAHTFLTTYTLDGLENTYKQIQEEIEIYARLRKLLTT